MRQLVCDIFYTRYHISLYLWRIKPILNVALLHYIYSTINEGVFYGHTRILNDPSGHYFVERENVLTNFKAEN